MSRRGSQPEDRLECSGLAEDPMWLLWQSEISKRHELDYESNPVIAYVNRFAHRWIESSLSDEQGLESILEVGAGSGEHIEYVNHPFERYYVTDASSCALNAAQKQFGHDPRFIFEEQDAVHLKYPDNSFDRLISLYTLEHLNTPHVAIKEWMRVVRPGGVISIAIPTEGGIAWNLGRFLTTRRQFRRMGLDLDYIISREHINACYRLVHLIDFYLTRKTTCWFPAHIPWPDVNLIYGCNAINV